MHARIAPYAKGFSLVELMVGLVIALLTSVVIFQAFALTERHKRTIGGASDAQVNGALALESIIREVRMAGFGTLSSVLSDCNPATTNSYYDSGSGTPGPLNLFSFPVQITDGGTGPDSIAIAMSGGDFDANFRFGRTTLRSTMPQSSSELNVNSTHGCGVGNLMVMVQPCTAGSTPAGSCTLMQITQVQATALKLQHNPGGTPSYNPSTSYQNTNNWPAFQMNSSCQAYGVCMPAPSNVGTSFGVATASNELTIQKGTAAAVGIAPGVMDLQAEYGLVAGVTGTPTWQSATSTWAGSGLTKAQVNQIKAIRVAVIARSGEYEKPESGTTCTTTTSVSGLSAWATFNTSTWPSDWQCYRYKVFETIIPLRNIIWAGV